MQGVGRQCAPEQVHHRNTAKVLFMRDHRVVYKCHSSECLALDNVEIGTWSAIVPARCEDLPKRNLVKLDAGVATALSASSKPKHQAFLIEYLNRQGHWGHSVLRVSVKLIPKNLLAKSLKKCPKCLSSQTACPATSTAYTSAVRVLTLYCSIYEN